MSIGIAFTPFETRVDVIARLAVQADELGLDRVSVAEGWTHDSTLVLAELAARTSRIGLATSVVSVWGRSPATLALAAAGLGRLSGGRFSLGIGAGSPPLAEGFHGVEWERPGARLRRTLTDVRALLGAERLPHPAPGARPLRLGVVPDAPVPLGLAALAPASIRMAGELADEWTPFLWSRSRVGEGRQLLAEGEAKGATGETRVAAGIPVALGADPETARALASWWLSIYCTRMGPLYPRMLAERFSMRDAVDAVVANESAELPDAAEALAEEVTLMGTHDEAAARIGAWFAAGADSVGLVLPPGRPEEELAAIVEVAARANRAAARAAA